MVDRRDEVVWVWLVWSGIPTSTNEGSTSLSAGPDAEQKRKGSQGLDICQQSNTERWIWLFITSDIWLMANAIFQLTEFQFSSVQSFSRVIHFVTPWTEAHQASLSITNSWSLLRVMSIKSMMPSNHLILCRPLFLWPSIFPSIRVFSNESTSHQVTKVLEIQHQHQPFQWTPRTDIL